ncbi:MAG TPA: hypothetical protein VFN55_01915 [Solirubrobacteraceae bacterium]|nr:hypothetical protein [Solirubrobacteraceae bacterium]
MAAAIRRVAVLAAFAWIALSAPAAARIYWGNAYSDTIGTANLDGSGVSESLVGTVGHPYGVAVDGAHLYWTNKDTIGRANLDGSGVDQSFITGAHIPGPVAVDSQHLYWGNGNTNTIGRANLDGTGVDQSFITGTDGVSALAVDGQHIYWGNSGAGTIGRANLDGTGVDQSFMTVSPGVTGVAVDSQHIYWTGGANVGRANVDGSAIDPRFISGVGTASGVTVDAAHVYWTNFGPNSGSGGTVGRANLDGSGVEASFIAGAHGPTGIAVDASTGAGGGTGGACVDQSVALGQVIAKGCLVAGAPGRFTASAPHAVRLNGIDFTPHTGTVTVDTRGRRLELSGGGSIAVGPATVSGWSGPVTLPLDTLPLRIDSGAGTALIGTRRFYGFALSSRLEVSFGPDQSSTLNGVLDLRALGDGVAASLKVTANNDKGLVSAQATVGRGADFGHGGRFCRATAPPPLGFQCAGPFTDSLGRQYFRLVPSDGQVVRLLGAIPVENVTLTYMPEGHEWDLAGTVALTQIFGHDGLPSLILGAGVQTDPFNLSSFQAGFADAQLPLPFPPETELTKLALSVRIRPHVQLTGSVGLEAGTEVGGRRPVGIDGDLALDFPPGGFKVDVHGTVNVLDQIQLGQGYVTVWTSQGAWNIAFGGNVGYSLGPVSLDARVNGAISPPHFQVSGDGSASVFGQGVSAHAVLSDAGIGACGTVHIAFFSGDIGFKYLWGHDGQPTFDGCDFSGLYTVNGATSAAVAPGARLRLPRGLAREEVAVTGDTGPPQVTLSGPGGAAVSTPSETDHIVASPGGVAVAAANARTTYFVLVHPRAGVWRVTPNANAPAITRIARADPIRPLRIRARVLGRGSVRRLVWRLAPQPGETVTFEQPSGVRPIVTTQRSTGVIRFTVAPGPAGRRRLHALVTIDGFPRQVVLAGAFRAPAPLVLRVRHVRAVVRRGRLTVTWGTVARADLFDVTVRLNGSALRFTLPGRRPRLAMALPAHARVRAVSVSAVVAGVTGPAAIRAAGG